MPDRTLTDDAESGPVDWPLIAKVADENDLIGVAVRLSMELGATVSISVTLAGSNRYVSVSTGNTDPLDEDEVSEVTARQVERG